MVILISFETYRYEQRAQTTEADFMQRITHQVIAALTDLRNGAIAHAGTDGVLRPMLQVMMADADKSYNFYSFQSSECWRGGGSGCRQQREREQRQRAR